MTFELAYKDFIFDRNFSGYNENGISANTLRNYNFFIHRVFITNFLFEKMNIIDASDLKIDHVKLYLLYLREKNLESVSIRTYYTHARIFLRYLYKEKIINFDVLQEIKEPKAYKKIREVYYDDEILMLFNSIRGKGLNACRVRLIFALAFDTGMRSDEILNIRLSDINLEKHYLRVRGLKTYEDRLVPLSYPTIKLIFQYLNVRPDPVNNPLDKDYLLISNKYKRLTKSSLSRYQKTYIKPIITRGNMHLFRHTYITRQIFLGKQYSDIQEIVGHSPEANTTRKYLRRVSQLRILDITFRSNEDILLQILRNI